MSCTAICYIISINNIIYEAFKSIPYRLLIEGMLLNDYKEDNTVLIQVLKKHDLIPEAKEIKE